MWDAFKDLIFNCIQALANVVGDWGLAIIIATLIFRAVLAPLMHKQIKSTYATQKLQPKITELQQRFADDPMRQQEEMQKLYAEAKFNPLAGCLPLLLQMPIFMAMFQTLRELSSHSDANYVFYSLVPDLTQTPSGAFAIDFVYFIPYVILMLIFAFATFLPMILQNLNNDSPQRNQMLIMGAVMSIMMLWISWSSPAGVLLFWGVSSIFGICQQQITQRYLKKADAAIEEAIEVKPVEVNVERKNKKKRPTKKSK